MAEVRSYTQLPQPRKNWVKRQRALDSLYAALDSRLILVVAGAGYGKTGLLAQFAKTEGFSFSWLTLDESEQDLRVLGEAVVAALARCFPGFGQQTMQLLTSATAIEQNVSLLAHTLAREISLHLTQPLCMVLDDFHLVEPSAPVVQFIDRFVAELPDEAHLVIASRSLPPLQLGLLIAQQQVSALGQSALRLDPTETRQLMASLSNVDVSEVEEDAAVKAFTETEGWLVGLLMTTHISRLREAQVGLSMPRAVDLLSDYLLVRVLQVLPSDLQEFLFRTSILDDLSLPFCQELGWTHTEEYIAEVERRNLFIQPLSAGNGAEMSYRYHPLFREFLQQRLREDEPIRHAQLQHDAGAAYERSNNIELAVRHFLTGGWSADVIRVIEAHGVDFLQRGRYRTILDWLARLDAVAPGIRQENHVLWQFEMLAHLNSGHDAEAMTAVDQLDELYSRTGDLGRRDGLNMRRGLLLYHASEYEKALACTKVVTESIYPQPIWAKMEAYRIASLCLLELGRLSTALQSITQAEELAQNLGPTGFEPLTRVKLARSSILDELGEAAGSLRAVSEALSLAEKTQDSSLLAESLTTMAQWLLYSGEQEHLLDTAMRGLELAEATGNRAVRIYSLRVLAMSLMAEGRADEALQTGATGLALARQSTLMVNKGWTLLLSLLEQCCMLCRRAQEQPSAAERDRLLHQALGMSREAVALADASKSARFQFWAYVRLGIIQLAQGDQDLADISLKKAESLKGQFNNCAVGQLRLWQLLKTWQERAPDIKRLSAQLAVVSGMVEFRNQTYFIRAEGEWAWQIYERLKSATNLGNMITERMPSEKQSVPSVHAIASVPSANLQIKLVQHDIRVCGFGVGQVWRGNELISTGEWGWSIPRELFFYILTLRQATRGQIGAVFWPEASPGTMQSSFHNAKFAIRTALGKPAMVYTNGQYSINSDLDYLYDVNTFEHLIARADQAPSPQALDHLLEAANTYQDDFLIEFTSEWTELQRSTLQIKFEHCCLSAAEIALNLKQPDAALNLLERAHQRDNINESLGRMLMNLQWQSGRRHAALQTYSCLKDALQDEMGIPPEPATEQLLMAIKTG